MSEILMDDNNYRVHSDENKNLINKSLSRYGVGRSILLDADNTIIAGNGVYEQAQNLNIPVETVETDGKELVVIVREDLHTEDKKRKELAVMDNSCSDMSEQDIDRMQVDFDDDMLVYLGVDKKNVGKKEYNNSEIDLDDLTNEFDCHCPQCDFEFARK